MDERICYPYGYQFKAFFSFLNISQDSNRTRGSRYNVRFFFFATAIHLLVSWVSSAVICRVCGVGRKESKEMG